MQDINSYALGSHLWFFKEGAAFTSPGAGVVAVADWPDAAEATWSEKFIGDTEGFEDTKNIEEVEVRKPSPGALVRKDIITMFQSLEFKATTNSLRRIAFEIMYGSAVALTEEEGTFVPLAATPPKGLLKIQRYTHENELVFAADLWVRAKLTGGMRGGNSEIIKPEFTFLLLDSTLNTMFFGDPSLLEA
jgi:hypothetical protein